MSLAERPTTVLAGWEMKGAVRSRWVLVVAALYTVLAVGITLVSLRSMSALGLRGVGAAIDGLIGLAVLIPPLFGILLGAGAISGAREQGMLALVAAQPLRRSTITWGTFLGMTMTVWAGLGVGLGLAAAIIAPTATGGDLMAFMVVVAVTLVAGAIGVGLGTLVSVTSSNRGQAMMVAIAIWFIAALGIDVILASLAPVALGPAGLLGVTIFNPLAALRMLAMTVVGWDSLGPFGVYLEGQFGMIGTRLLFGVVVVSWLYLPMLIATSRMRRSDI